ncbi:9377_t:CDS:2 [Cetraspora pellucida]|uniref:9377_t:CDS:1 n=1 Tax=Cetraspora pellucida TaxID=1433469 RepID=A0A9N9GJ17_9GLOM|nr:9377_t:CDS:2 [Cetraspora pellucida]
MKIYNLYHFPCLRGSVIPWILPSTLLVTVIATIITILYELTEVKLSIDGTFINVIGIVIGLLLTYRITVASERYWEAVNHWTVMTASIRCMSRIIWIYVDESEETEERTADILGKKAAIKLLLAFAKSTKHQLRGEEDPVNCNDVKPLISNFRSFISYDNNFRNVSNSGAGLSDRLFKQKNCTFDSSYKCNLNILSYLFAYLQKITKDGKANEITISILNENLIKINECLSNLDKFINTPKPISYSILISQTVWIYCLLLPFQLIANSGWATIPLVFLMVFILFSAYKTGLDIEDPFGYDFNDIDLDYICR